MASNLKPAELTDSQNKEGWTFVSDWSRVRNLPLAPKSPYTKDVILWGSEKESASTTTMVIVKTQEMATATR